MPQVDPELAELAQNPRIPVDVLAAAQFTSRQLSEHWQACTSGAHYHVAVALVDATTGRMAVHLAADGALSPISGHLASWDLSVRHAEEGCTGLASILLWTRLSPLTTQMSRPKGSIPSRVSAVGNIMSSWPNASVPSK